MEANMAEKNPKKMSQKTAIILIVGLLLLCNAIILIGTHL